MDDGLTRVSPYHQVRSEPPPPSLAASQTNRATTAPPQKGQ